MAEQALVYARKITARSKIITNPRERQTQNINYQGYFYS